MWIWDRHFGACMSWGLNKNFSSWFTGLCPIASSAGGTPVFGISFAEDERSVVVFVALGVEAAMVVLRTPSLAGCSRHDPLSLLGRLNSWGSLPCPSIALCRVYWGYEGLHWLTCNRNVGYICGLSQKNLLNVRSRCLYNGGLGLHTRKLSQVISVGKHRGTFPVQRISAAAPDATGGFWVLEIFEELPPEFGHFGETRGQPGNPDHKVLCTTDHSCPVAVAIWEADMTVACCPVPADLSSEHYALQSIPYRLGT